jgi:GAF domain-containing protein
VDFDFNRLVAEAVREMAAEPTVSSTLERAVQMCVEAVAHCDMVGISVIEDRRVRTVAASGERLQRIDQLQFELEQGPCYEALKSHAVVTVNDLATDARWPAFGPRLAEETGLRSSLSYRLYTDGESLGSLNLYAYDTNAFTTQDVIEGQVVAAHASAALAAAIHDAHLQRAIRTRTVIGQATGILIERFGVAPDQAFAILRRISQNHNVKVAALAQQLVDTGVLVENGGMPKPAPARPAQPRVAVDADLEDA